MIIWKKVTINSQWWQCQICNSSFQCACCSSSMINDNSSFVIVHSNLLLFYYIWQYQIWKCSFQSAAPQLLCHRWSQGGGWSWAGTHPQHQSQGGRASKCSSIGCLLLGWLSQWSKLNTCWSKTILIYWCLLITDHWPSVRIKIIHI